MGSFIITPLYLENMYSFLLSHTYKPYIVFSSILATSGHPCFPSYSDFLLFSSLLSQNLDLKNIFLEMISALFLFLIISLYFSVPICYVLLILSALNSNPFRIRNWSYSVVYKCTLRLMGMHLGGSTELHRLKKLCPSNTATELTSSHEVSSWSACSE